MRSYEITRLRYQWRPLELSPENDFIGFDGEILIGRIFLEPRPRFNGLWHWSNIMSETPIASQGYSASADLAAVTVEALYDELRAFEGNALAKSQ